MRSLYPPEGAHWWSAADHAAVVTFTQALGARRVLEFGPGTSTLSLIEGGAEQIDSCEDDPHWFAIYCRRLEDRFPGVVTMRPYNWTDPLHVRGLADEPYDLALIDGPQEVARRPAAIAFALARSRFVAVPLEEGDEHGDNGLRAAVERTGRIVTYIESGPLAGSFALIGPR